MGVFPLVEIKGCIGDKAGRLGQLAILADRMSATTVLGGRREARELSIFSIWSGGNAGWQLTSGRRIALFPPPINETTSHHFDLVHRRD